jgi:hypothetical protein
MITRAIGALLLYAASAQALAEPPQVVLPSPAPAHELVDAGPTGQSLDHWHDRLFLGVQDFISHLDERYIDDPDKALPVPVSPFRIGLQAESLRRSDGTVDTAPRIDVDLLLKMPNLQRKLQLFITSDTVDESPDRLGNRLNDVRAGLRYSLLNNLDFDVGLRADLPPVAFTSVRWQKQWSLADWQLQPFIKAYAETKRGIGVASGVNLERWIDHWVLRSASYANWRRDSADTQWTQAFIVARASEVIRFGRYSDVLGGKDFARGFGLEGKLDGSRTKQLETYEVSLFAKQPTARRWLYWQAAVFLRWDRERSWHADPGIRLSLDALFWDRAAR